MTKFEVGKTYGAQSICDHECIFEVKIIKRTAATVTIEGFRDKRCKIHTDRDGNEWIMPERYSMAPIFYANRQVA